MGTIEWLMDYWNITREQAQQVLDNPCIGDYKERGCQAYPNCAGCTSLNGLFFLKFRKEET